MSFCCYKHCTVDSQRARNLSHTRMVVQECFNDDQASQWRMPKFDPTPHQNPLTDLNKNLRPSLSHVDGTRHAEFCNDGFSVSTLQVRHLACLRCDKFFLRFWGS